MKMAASSGRLPSAPTLFLRPHESPRSITQTVDLGLLSVGRQPSTVMEGLGRGLGRGKDGLVRGTEVGLEWTANAARRGLEAADNAAHVMGINRIPVLRQCLWGQVHTGFWSSYSVSSAVPPAPGRLRVCIDVRVRSRSLLRKYSDRKRTLVRKVPW